MATYHSFGCTAKMLVPRPMADSFALSPDHVPSTGRTLVTRADGAILHGEGNRDGRGAATNRTAGNEARTASGFAAGTLIATARGEIAADRLRVGDRVFTLDGGYQPVLWADGFELNGSCEEIEFPPGSLGEGPSSRPLTVTLGHRVLLRGARLSLLFGESEGLAEAGDFTPRTGVFRRPTAADVRFHQILLPRHEIILANGVLSESLFAGAASMAAQPDPVRRQILALAGDGHRESARLCLTRCETALALDDTSADDLAAA
ncbi:hypothetical protein DEA8626_00166 [Defluviimonas aquaemixtae]|uniref:Hedgehog/Intein (Hint) domain-containing protein n=1 Tax=Albidovulum aquaemixtae TaxID=1542388 RepID=A0A2R8B282_9RHOB|nr:Hint domain-containing protein [Defluviimonas aquaemixtae]SPH16655.1 hypothetical protein DEA8626_00166 [Defluviimonas aquaemixtae]